MVADGLPFTVIPPIVPETKVSLNLTAPIAYPSDPSILILSILVDDIVIVSSPQPVIVVLSFATRTPFT